ncbi:hypothetical protein NUW54_g103 [Trametes sanguinea]|uniref:Uncharacterized protein n=1 Tax=Trametes sanguinea TaxID=158606 RepID=A0ACC1QD55_9APHY|nr:hypothetical protein NUW54_g103 [Trametes sanguinea]
MGCHARRARLAASLKSADFSLVPTPLPATRSSLPCLVRASSRVRFETVRASVCPCVCFVVRFVSPGSRDGVAMPPGVDFRSVDQFRPSLLAFFKTGPSSLGSALTYDYGLHFWPSGVQTAGR